MFWFYFRLSVQQQPGLGSWVKSQGQECLWGSSASGKSRICHCVLKLKALLWKDDIQKLTFSLVHLRKPKCAALILCWCCVCAPGWAFQTTSALATCPPTAQTCPKWIPEFAWLHLLHSGKKVKNKQWTTENNLHYLFKLVLKEKS